MNKEGSWKPVIIVFIATLFIATFWNNIEGLRNAIRFVLDPTVGWLLNWNLTLGMLIIVFIIAVITSLVQKYATDQKTLREMKKEQKLLQKEMKKYRENPEKILEMQKKQMEFMPRIMKLSMRPMIFTGIPFILFFRWFLDFFETMGNPQFFGFLSWFWFYLIFTLLFSSILRKALKVA